MIFSLSFRFDDDTPDPVCFCFLPRLPPSVSRVASFVASSLRRIR